MNVISGTTAELPEELLSRVSSYRHKVFVEMLGWELQTQNGVELDQFDRPDTLYVITQDEQGRVNGCARLLPTHRPYLLGEVFPQLLNGLPPPARQTYGNSLALRRWTSITRPQVRVDNFLHRL